ncbi:hypothetical protein M405DRAFT_746953 [Rhizopogon salebrosus TDB-379]|nr:hypothetical protein M405DRAFT_746953 [Rhizopogon salebrosus TDB-379]
MISALCTALQVLGLLITVLRLGYRVRIRLFWVEDMWAVAALICVVVISRFYLLVWAYIYPRKDGQLSIIAFWVYSFAFPSAIWAVRQSILFSLARIFWGTRSLRLLAYTISLTFLVFYGALVSQKAWQYGHNLDWYSHPNTNGKVNAYLTRPMIIFELITDCIADVILISLSLRLLWGIKLPAGKRMMILAAFSSSVFVTLVSIIRATFQIMRFRRIIRIATDLELAISLITCNILVATTYIYGVMTRRRSNVSGSKSKSNIESSQEVTALSSRSPVTFDGTGQLLTTLDLSACTNLWNESDEPVAQTETSYAK